MQYLQLILVLVALGYIVLRVVRANTTQRTTTRVIGPDDDPDLLWKLGHGDNKPR